MKTPEHISTAVAWLLFAGLGLSCALSGTFIGGLLGLRLVLGGAGAFLLALRGRSRS